MSGPVRVLVAAGGTAGHVVPAIAIADALRAEGAQVSFVGADRAEKDLVPAAGYALDRLDVTGISRTSPKAAAKAVAKAARSLTHARAIVKRRDPHVVLGGGGYVAGPVGLAATLQRRPLVLTEADSHLGLTNRLLAPRAQRVCLAFPLEGRDGDRYRVTGRPVPPKPPEAERGAARAAFGIGEDERCVLVFGGSLGARSINQAAIEAFAGAGFRVLHAAGRRDFPELTAPGEHYDLRAYISPFGPALAAADLAVARSGGSVFELAQYGVPAVLVPYPHASADHQTANARWMERGGAAIVIADADLTAARLASEVGGLLADPSRLAQMARAAAALARPHAAEDIAEEVLAAAAGRRDR